MYIKNDTSHIFSPSSQEAIKNAMANAGLYEVVTRTNRPHDEVDNIFNFYDNDGNYQFSIDVEGDIIFHNQYPR